MVYRLESCRLDVPELAARLDREPSVDLVAYRDGDRVVVRKEGEELARAERRLSRRAPPAGRRSPQPQRRRHRSSRQLPGYEFADLGGRDHAGGGSHGSLVAGDSEVPVLLAGVEGEPRSIVDFAPLVLSHFGV